MNKFLRLTLSAFLMMFAVVMSAQTTVTFTAGTDKGADGGTAGDNVTLTKDGITLTVSNGVLGRTDNYRVYKGQTITVASTVGNITKVVFTCTANGTAKYGPGNFTDATAGTYTYEENGATGTWTGDAASFSLTASTNQVRATKIEVTFTPNGNTPAPAVTAPTITGDTPFTTTTTVTITAEGAAEIYYTTDGTDPDDESASYTQPLTLDKTTTVKAVAADDAGNLSTVTTKEFVKESAVKTVTIADFNAAAESTSDWYQLTGTVSNLKSGDKYGNFDLTDESGTVYVYGLLAEKGGSKGQFQTLVTEKGIANGSKLTLIGNRGSYEDKIEVTNAYFVSVDNSGVVKPDDPTTVETTGDGTEAKPYTTDDVKKLNDANALPTTEVYVEGAVTKLADGQAEGIAEKGWTDLTYFIQTAGNTNELEVYRGKALDGADFTAANLLEAGDKVVVCGTLTVYNGTLEFAKGSKVVSLATPVTVSASGYATLYYSGRSFTIPEGVEAYTYTVSDGKLSQAAVSTTIPAGEAVVLKAASGTYDFVVTTEAGKKAESNDLLGTDTEKALDADADSYFYQVNTKNGVVGFYWGADEGAAFTNGAHKAYLKVAKTDAKGAKGFRFDGATTGINSINSAVRTQNAALYNLNGQRVNENYRGVVIVNGKKMIKK